MKDAKAVRKHAAQHDLFNRIHSIAADEAFVHKVSTDWYSGRFDVVPNQRCGTWYCNPSTSSKQYAYFKSTDGHTNNWNFNLRRSNLPLASHAEEREGLIIVDSTRRGKRMPDALSKTVPIWCTVINLTLQLRQEDAGQVKAGWDSNLYLPPNIVSSSEKAQIQALIPTWAAALDVSTLNIPDLSKPLRPFFIHPATTSPPVIPENPDYTPIICVSASRWVGGDYVPSVTRVGARTVGYDYVPGAGDDDELWARGLKPGVYHANREGLLAEDRDDLEDLVDRLVGGAKELSLDGLTLSEPAMTVVGIPDAMSRIATDLGKPVAAFDAWSGEENSKVYIVQVDKPIKEPLIQLDQGVLVAVPNPRIEGRAYSQVLAALLTRAKESQTTRSVLLPARRSDIDLAISRKEGDTFTPSIMEMPLTEAEMISARKTIIPILVALDCSLDGPSDSEENAIDKGVIADSLHRLVALWPDGNPPRAALKRVNEVLMSSNR